MKVLLINPAISSFYRFGWNRREERRFRMGMFLGLALPHDAGIIGDRCSGRCNADS